MNGSPKSYADDLGRFQSSIFSLTLVWILILSTFIENLLKKVSCKIWFIGEHFLAQKSSLIHQNSQILLYFNYFSVLHSQTLYFFDDILLNKSGTALLKPLLFSRTKNAVSSSILPWLKCFLLVIKNYFFLSSQDMYFTFTNSRLE